MPEKIIRDIVINEAGVFLDYEDKESAVSFDPDDGTVLFAEGEGEDRINGSAVDASDVKTLVLSKLVHHLPGGGELSILYEGSGHRTVRHSLGVHKDYGLLSERLHSLTERAPHFRVVATTVRMEMFIQTQGGRQSQPVERSMHQSAQEAKR